MGESYPWVDAAGCVQQCQIQQHQRQTGGSHTLSHPCRNTRWTPEPWESPLSTKRLSPWQFLRVAESKAQQRMPKVDLIILFFFPLLVITAFWVNKASIQSDSIQSPPSPIGVYWRLHPPTTSVDRTVLWILSLFSLVTKEKSGCYVHAAVPTVFCPYVSPSAAWLAQIQPPPSDLMTDRKQMKHQVRESRTAGWGANL